MFTKVSLDFRKDFRDLFLAALTSHLRDDTHDRITELSDPALIVCYLNWRRRLIDPRPRKLLPSREFTKTMARPEFAERTNNILFKIHHGSDLTPHLSKKDTGYS